MRHPDFITVRRWTERLYEEFDHLCFTYRLRLSRPVVCVREFTSRKWGEWDPESRTIALSHRLIEQYSWDVVLEILKHEMAHQYARDVLAADDGHGPVFQQACDRLGVADWARRAETDLGEPLAGWKAQPPDTVESRLLQRVEKLLALATSSNEHEALMAMQKVRELYAKHNLDRVIQRRDAKHVYLSLATRKKRLPRHYFVIASLLNEHFFVRVIHSSLFHAEDLCDYKAIELLGTRENVLMAEYVYHFLLNQLSLLWDDYRRQNSKHGRARSSYYLGVLSGFRTKLDKDKVASEPVSGSRALVALDDRALENFVSFRYPRLVSFQRSKLSGDRDAYEAGKKEGSKLVLHRGLSHSQGNLGKFLP